MEVFAQLSSTGQVFAVNVEYADTWDDLLEKVKVESELSCGLELWWEGVKVGGKGEEVVQGGVAQGDVVEVRVVEDLLEKKKEEMIKAVSEGKVNDIQRLHKQGIDVVQFEHEEGTLLHFAAKFQVPKSVRTLVRLGCDINALKKNTLKTPLMLASRSKNPSTVKTLLNLGANPHLTDRNGNTALHCAANIPSTNFEIFDLLTSAGCNVNAQNNKGKTPAHLGNAHYLETLGADLTIRCNANLVPGEYNRNTSQQTPDYTSYISSDLTEWDVHPASKGVAEKSFDDGSKYARRHNMGGTYTDVTRPPKRTYPLEVYKTAAAKFYPAYVPVEKRGQTRPEEKLVAFNKEFSKRTEGVSYLSACS